MRFRRSISILSGICALSLTLGRSDSDCENAGSEMRVAASGATSAHAEMPMQSHTGDQHKPCESATAACCQAMTSCGLSIQLTRTASDRDALSRKDLLPAAPLQIPLDRITPPEPPPPKA